MYPPKFCARMAHVRVRRRDRQAVGAVGRGMRRGELRFRVRNPLAYFSREYDATNSEHELRIGFHREADLRKLAELVLPRMRELAAW